MRTQIKTYTFTPGTRQITVTDDITFTKADIAVIVNRTQQKVLFTIPDYNLITDVTNKVITYDNSLPVLAENDVLWIEIDIEITATKIVREDPIVTEVNGEYHPNDYNLVYELAQHIPNDYPHCYIVKFAKDSETTALNGADAYYTSDGSFYELNTTHTWNDWNNNKVSRYVIYAFANRDVNAIFSTIGIANIQELMFDDVTVATITMTSAIISRVWCTNKTEWSDTASVRFDLSTICYADLTGLKTLTTNAFTTCTALTSLNIQHVENITGVSHLSGTKISSLYLSKIINVPGGNGGFFSGSVLKYLYLGKSLQSTGTLLFNKIAGVLILQLEPDFNTELYIVAATLLTNETIMQYIIPNLKDNTGLTAKTITFATVVYNALNTAGYLPLFTAKNWNVASA